MSKAKTLIITVLLTTATTPVLADVKLPAVISDNVVLQQNSKANLWGWADPGEKIIVKASWLFGKLAVRFAFTNNEEPNLCNKEGLPASSFRTDNW